MPHHKRLGKLVHTPIMGENRTYATENWPSLWLSQRPIRSLQKRGYGSGCFRVWAPCWWKSSFLDNAIPLPPVFTLMCIPTGWQFEAFSLPFTLIRVACLVFPATLIRVNVCVSARLLLGSSANQHHLNPSPLSPGIRGKMLDAVQGTLPDHNSDYSNSLFKSPSLESTDEI